MAHCVFISYSSVEAEYAQLVQRVLETNGISCWIAPRDIPLGSNYTAEIPSAIRNCEVVVLLLSPSSQASFWVLREMETAVKNRKTIIPLMLEDFTVCEEFNFLLGASQRHAAYEKKSDALELLVASIHAILDAKKAARSKKEASRSLVRFDGVYQGPRSNGQRCWLRFFPDGTAAYTRYRSKKGKTDTCLFPGTANLPNWFHSDFPIRGKYDTKSDRFSLPFSSDKFPDMQMEVRINTPDELVLRFHWNTKDPWQEQKMEFIPVQFPEKRTNCPKQAVSLAFGPIVVPEKPKPAPEKSAAPVQNKPVSAPQPASSQSKPVTTPVAQLSPSPIPSLPVVPTPIEDWKMPAHKNLRYDGIYQSQVENGDYRYLRFSPTGRVSQAYTSCLPFTVMRWLNWASLQGGECYFSKTAIHFPIRSGTYIAMTYEGTVGINSLSLKAYIPDQRKMRDYQFTFIPYPENFSGDAEPFPFGDDPSFRIKRLFAGTREPRFDGYYRSEKIGEGRTYLRFYPTGEVYETYHVGPDSAALPFLKIADKDGGFRLRADYKQNNDFISFTIPIPAQKTEIRYYGQVKDNELIMEVTYKAFDRTLLQKFTFVPSRSDFF